MRHIPTPRDLFNPPLQNTLNALPQDWMDDLREEVWDLNPTGDYTKEQKLFYDIIEILKEFEKRTRDK
jgi:hypothetical protein